MKRNTKEIICREALRLFSIYGYEGVSTKAIADAVGIKDSSLYNHFKSKREIFNQLQEQYRIISEKFMHQLDEACNADKLCANSFQSVNDIFFEKYLMDDFCNCFFRLMLIEQSDNAQMQQLCTKWMLDMPIQFQSKIFAKLNLLGEVSADKYDYLALKFYSPIYFYTHKYLLTGELTHEKKSLFRTAVGKHIKLFMQEIGGKIDG